jgi:hypothetical protein
MLLAVPPPSLIQPDLKSPHDHYSTFKHRHSSPESPRNIPSLFSSAEDRMSNPHRGLPLPAGLHNLPPPDRNASAASSLGHLPAPPSQWAGQDDSMRSWLHAKAEEDRRKQEEEKTRQEGLRLDQRRIEERMLRDSLQGGVPPPMVPLIFAGLGGGQLPAQALEWAQQYLASLTIQNQQQQQQQQSQPQQIQQGPQMSPDMRRDSRMIPANPYGSSQSLQPLQSSPQLSSQAHQTHSRPLGSSINAPPQSSALSRLNTADFVPASHSSPHQGQSQAGQRQPLHPLQQPQIQSQSQSQIQSQSQSQTATSEQGAGPGLFFHHWTPPNPGSAGAGTGSSGSGLPPTPSGKSAQSSPFNQPPNSHLRSEYQNSPKKRKVAGGQQVGVPPTSQPQGDVMDTSPPYSARSSREREREREGGREREGNQSPALGSARRHSRQLSNASSGNGHGNGNGNGHGSSNIARPSSRQQRQEEMAAGGGPSRQMTGSSTSASSDEQGGSARYEMKSEAR